MISGQQDIPLRTFYRIVWTDPPSLEDFLSHLERGVEVRVEDAEIARLSSGISVFRTLAQARRMAIKRPPWLGRGFIVRIVMPLGVETRIERTTKTAGHYTLWGNASLISSWVDAVEPVTIAGHGIHDL